MYTKPTKRQLRAIALAVLLVASPLSIAITPAGATMSEDGIATDTAGQPASFASTTAAASSTNETTVFTDDFENEAADTGAPENWSVVDQTGEIEVNNSVAESGTQSVRFYQDYSYIERNFTDAEYPGRVRTSLQTGSGSGAVMHVIEGDTQTITLVKSGSDLYYRNSTDDIQYISTTLSNDEWVNVEVYDFDVHNETFSVDYSSPSDSGTATGLEMRNPMDSGMDSLGLQKNNAQNDSYFDNVTVTSTASDVSGRVTTCPVSNPTCQNPTGAPDGTIVEYVGVRESLINPEQGQTLQERAQEIRDDIEQIDYDSFNFDPNRDLQSEYRDTNADYVAFHDPGDWRLDGSDSADTSSPRIILPADQDVIVSVWDPSCDNRIQDGIDSGLPGCAGLDSPDSIVFEQLTYDNEVADTHTVYTGQTQQLGDSGIGPSGAEHHYARVNLAPGFYRVSPEGSPYSTVVSVGDPDQQIRAITSELETEANAMSERGQTIIDRANNDTIVRGTTATYTANGTAGQFNVSVPEDVNVVQMQAYTPAAEDVNISDVQNASFSNLQTYADMESYNESFYITPAPVSVDVPSNDANIRAVQVNSLPFGDIGSSLNTSDFLDRLMQNETLARALVGQLESVQAMNDSEVQALHDNLSRLARENEVLREQLNNRDDINVTLESDQSTDALRSEVTALRQEINQLEGELQAGDSQTDVSDGTIDATIPWDGDLDPSAVAVTANNIQTGDTSTVSEEYWSVNKRTGQSDQVLIEGYPIADSTAQITFGVTVVGEDGTSMGETRVNARNPAYSGQFVSVDAVDVSAIAPGPSQEIAVEPDLDEDSPDVQNVTATVYGPNGERPITHDDETIQFETNGSGAYNIQLQITDVNGQQWTEMVAIEAQNETITRPPSIRAMDGFTGDVALVGAGLTSGEINTDGSTLSVSAVAPTDNTPSELHVYTESLSNSHDETTVRLLEETSSGEPEQTRTRAKVFLHVAELDDDTILYREGPEPLGYEDQTAYGGALESDDGDGHTIVTHTEADGSVTVETIQNPGPVASTMWEVRKGAPFTIPRVDGLNPFYALFFDTFGFLSDLLGLVLDMVATSPTGGVTAPEPTTVAGPTTGGVAA